MRAAVKVALQEVSLNDQALFTYNVLSATDEKLYTYNSLKRVVYEKILREFDAIETILQL